MESFLDIRTLALMMGIISSSFSICMFYLYLYHKTYSGFLCFTMSAVAGGIGGILLCLRGIIPDYLSVIVANISIVLFPVFVSWGMANFTEKRISRRPDLILLAIFIVLFIRYTSITPDVEARIAIVSLVLCAFYLKTSWILLGLRSQLWSRFLFYNLTITAIWFLLRAIITLYFPWHTTSFMNAGSFQAFAFIVFIVSQLLVIIGVLFANYQRIESELTIINRSLQDNEEKFRSLSDAAFEGIVLTRKGIIVESNTALCTMLGYTPSELTGKNVLDFIPIEERENVERKIKTGFEDVYESVCLKKDGTSINVEVHGRMFIYKNEQVRVSAIRDISRRKEAEKALQLAHQKVLDMAMQDGLTGVANRRSFDEKCAKEWSRMMRAQQPLSVIIFDVDHFKLYNDIYGHQAGDGCLKKIAAEAASHFKRPSDLVARYGGEEFSVILPNTRGEGAYALAEQVRKGIFMKNIPHESSLVSERVTISCGVASMVPARSTRFEQLLKLADDALYEAKEGGATGL